MVGKLEKKVSKESEIEKGPEETTEKTTQKAGVKSSKKSQGSAVEMKWYVVHTYSGYEEKARKALLDRIKKQKFDKSFSEILVPTENVVEVVKGVKKTTTKRFFPGYILVRMKLTNEAWHVVKGTPKITGFVGHTMYPPAVPDEEVRRLTSEIEEGKLKTKRKADYSLGDKVRVIDGPFASFNGVVEEVKPDKEKVRVLVSIFGRATPVELNFSQVEKG